MKVQSTADVQCRAVKCGRVFDIKKFMPNNKYQPILSYDFSQLIISSDFHNTQAKKVSALADEHAANLLTFSNLSAE